MRALRLAAVALVTGLSLLAEGCGGGDDRSAADTETVQTSATELQPAATEQATTAAEPEPETEQTRTEPEESGTSPAPLVTITVVGGRPEGGIARVTVDRGERVRLRVRSDIVDQVHLHGYDVEWDVGPGQARTVVVEATVPGRFELELHETGTQIGELTVRP